MTDIQNPIARMAIVTDTGTEVTMIEIPQVVGSINIEQVAEEVDVPIMNHPLTVPSGKIKELVIRIPVERSDTGTVFTYRRLKNA
jgi:hypothetical protein